MMPSMFQPPNILKLQNILIKCTTIGSSSGRSIGCGHVKKKEKVLTIGQYVQMVYMIIQFHESRWNILLTPTNKENAMGSPP